MKGVVPARGDRKNGPVNMIISLDQDSNQGICGWRSHGFVCCPRFVRRADPSLNKDANNFQNQSKNSVSPKDPCWMGHRY